MTKEAFLQYLRMGNVGMAIDYDDDGTAIARRYRMDVEGEIYDIDNGIGILVEDITEVEFYALGAV